MGQLNIKDEALIADARALAEEMGTSVTGVLREGVRALRAERRRQLGPDQDAFVAELLALGARTASLMQPHLRSSDHAEFYDEQGLPR